MPVSDYHHIPAVLDEVERLMPRSVIELGVGFGKWGVLLRELLDARYGRVDCGTWQARINGREIFERYSNPVWMAYNLIHCGDFAEYSDSGYDLVMMMDSLEHLAPEPGMNLLRALVEVNGHVIISVPNGPMPQGETFGNPHEAHLTTFYGPEFAEFDPKVLYAGVCLVLSIKGKLE